MKKILNTAIVFAASIFCAILFMGYGHTETHPFLNEVIVLKFLEKVTTGVFSGPNKDKFKNFEFNWNNLEQPTLTGPAIHGDYYVWYSASDEVDDNMTPMKWISEGGWMEDEPWAFASLCHFYDPLGIDNGHKYLTDCSGAIESYRGIYQLKMYSTRDALKWATDDPDHAYSWKIGKENIVKALKEPNPILKTRYMAIAYRCLGQVLHLVCDMGCTPHVRNDSHPPNVYIPFGLGVFDLQFWKAIGDPDPDEDIAKKLDVFSLWQLNPPNKNFVDGISKTEKFDSIFDNMARFTNERFFSGQTIYTDRYKPVLRPNNPYPNPKMTEANYNKEEHTYYQDYDGVRVKMCKDLVALPFLQQIIVGKDSARGRPYLDYDCVESMSSALYPNIAEAGANVIRLFIPSLKMEITEAKLDSGGIVRGKITYTLPSFDDEYAILFDRNNVYNGPVSLFLNGKDAKIKVDAKNNYFEFKQVGNLKKYDVVLAKLDVGGIVLKSNEKMITDDILPSRTAFLGTVQYIPDSINFKTLYNMYTIRSAGVWDGTMNVVQRGGTDGIVKKTLKITWNQPPSGNYQVVDGAVFWKLNLNFEFQTIADYDYVNTPNINIKGLSGTEAGASGGYSSWRPSLGEPNFCLKLATDNFSVAAGSVHKYSVTKSYDITLKLDCGSSGSNKSDGYITFPIKINNFFAEDFSVVLNYVYPRD